MDSSTQRLSTMDMKEEVKKLWRICFDDTPDFVELYFRMRYREELNMGIVRNGRLLSALQIIPYGMSSWGTVFPAAYLSGVCTHPDARKQGLMRQLLAQTHRRLYAESCPVSTLIPAEPWLFDCYGVSGYAPVFCYDWTTVTVPEEEDTSFHLLEYKEDNEGVYAYFDQKMHERPCCIQHSEKDFQVILADLYLSDGQLWVARNPESKEVCGLAFCVPQTEDCLINELMYDEESVKRALICRACHHFHVSRAEVLHPSSDDKHRLGMLRIVRVDDILTRYAAAHPSEERCWIITDPEIPENNGCFQIQQGCFQRVDIPTAHAEPITIGQLASLLWKNAHPYMSLMLN